MSLKPCLFQGYQRGALRRPAKTRFPSGRRSFRSQRRNASLSDAISFLEAVPKHVEPLNALSFPTWLIHASSVIDWIVAMGLVRRYASITERPIWKSLAWGMLPLHASGMCACTYHFFYNAPDLDVLVALQAFLTCVGNTTLLIAAYRISQTLEGEEIEEKDIESSERVALDRQAQATASNARPSEPYRVVRGDYDDLDVTFWGKLIVLSFLGASAVKYGSLWIDAPFQPDLKLASAMIIVPTVLTMLTCIDGDPPGTEDSIKSPSDSPTK